MLEDILPFSSLNESSEFPSPQLIGVINDTELTVGAKTSAIIHLLLEDARTSDSAMRVLHVEMNKQLAKEIDNLSSESSGLHFNNAAEMSEEKLRNFEVDDLASQMQQQAPLVWTTMSSLFSASPERARKRQEARDRAQKKGSSRKSGGAQPRDGDIEMADVEPAVGDGDADDDATHPAGDGEQGKGRNIRRDEAARRAQERAEKQLLIRKVVVISMLLQSTNQRCNALQSAVGIFLHSCNCPDTIIDFLSRLGISVSSVTINTGITKLSAEAEKAIVTLVQTLMVLLAYDNVDLEFKHLVPTVETPGSTSVHLTAGTYIPLRNATLEDLKCADKLWEKSMNNPDNDDKTSSLKPEPPQVPLEDLLTIFEDTDAPDSDGLVEGDRFSAWKFLHDLTHHGPKWFHQFRSRVGEPRQINCLPVEKTTQLPCRTLKVHPATAAENAEAMDKFLKQGGVGDPSEEGQKRLKPLDNYVMLFFGDLLTGDRIRGLLQSRGEEDTQYRRQAHVVYVMGLFHLKMAAADAIWRIFIRPKKNRKTEMDENSLLSYVGELRPKETGKIESKPGFRRMHEIIQHVGIVSRLDCWRLAAKCDTIEEFAAKEPSWDDLKIMAAEIVQRHVTSITTLEKQRNKPDNKRDLQYENSIIRHQYFLLYEELSHAMNFGDIGRLEQCMMPWMFIFQGCGKHKYAAELRRYLENMYFIYPEGLRKVIRSNILANPTGKKGCFRAIDWIVEHNNLYTKRIYGGSYSNRDVDRIILESPLIEIFKNIRRQFERMFCLEDHTVRHSPPDMTATFRKLAIYMKDHKANEVDAPRTSKYSIRDIAEIGITALLMEEEGLSRFGTSAEQEIEDDDADAEGETDDEAELGDDGAIDGYGDEDEDAEDIDDDGTLDDDL